LHCSVDAMAGLVPAINVFKLSFERRMFGI
jgi:hypothetical protein